ncbi:MAG: hypothetical protein IPL21_13965 [Saprospirales bacterium]|nr:hypothetical protein [Saprospirales bacterium]
MNNKDLFINGFLERIGKEYPQDANPKRNLDLAFEIFGIASVLDKPFQEVLIKLLSKIKILIVQGAWMVESMAFGSMI